MTTDRDGIFWLHVKKSAGISTRRALAPLYREVDRAHRPTNFIQADQDEYNDILNNYRVPLGDYQFRRCQFAKRYLFVENWDRLEKFAFSREPVDRCVSQFFYLYHRPGTRASLRRMLSAASRGRFEAAFRATDLHYQFDAFLEMVASALASGSNYSPFGLHFQTHIAPMWGDVSDEDGGLMLDHVFRLEIFQEAVNMVRTDFGLAPLTPKDMPALNKSTKRAFTPSARQRSEIERLFAKDFELYEGPALRAL